MLVFLDESFRNHRSLGHRFGVLAGIAIPEDIYPALQDGIHGVRRPYFDTVVKEEDALHGNQLLTETTFRVREQNGYSYHWNLTEELILYARRLPIRVFAVVCFDPAFHAFSCGDERLLDPTFRFLFERIDRYMKLEFPGRYAKLVFDDRGRPTNEKNARAITNFFVRSRLGLGFDSIVRVPFFAIARTHNYGMQLADVITTVVAKRFEGDRRTDSLWRAVRSMLHVTSVGGRPVTSMKVIRGDRDRPMKKESGDP